MKITISKRSLNNVIKMLEAYKLNCELSDINLFGANHPYCNDPERYKDIQHYIDKFRKEISR